MTMLALRKIIQTFQVEKLKLHMEFKMSPTEHSLLIKKNTTFFIIIYLDSITM